MVLSRAVTNEAFVRLTRSRRRWRFPRSTSSCEKRQRLRLRVKHLTANRSRQRRRMVRLQFPVGQTGLWNARSLVQSLDPSQSRNLITGFRRSAALNVWRVLSLSFFRAILIDTERLCGGRDRDHGFHPHIFYPPITDRYPLITDRRTCDTATLAPHESPHATI